MRPRAHYSIETPPPPSTTTISLHGALRSTYQAFKLDGRQSDSYAYTVKRTECKKKERNQCIIIEEKKKLWLLSFVNLIIKILYQSSMHLFLRGKNVGEPEDAVFASRWGSAAMETDLDLSVIHY